MRARMALMHCGVVCELREVTLKAKPAHLLQVSNKGTVPVLILPTSTSSVFDQDVKIPSEKVRVIDESLDIMHWAINEHITNSAVNAETWQETDTTKKQLTDVLIQRNDFEFKVWLDKYKYSDRHPENPKEFYLQKAMPFLETLENLLCESSGLTGDRFKFADAAIMPFIRQFSMVEPKVFAALPFPRLQQWLENGLSSPLFLGVMHKFPLWTIDGEDDIVLFGNT